MPGQLSAEMVAVDYEGEIEIAERARRYAWSGLRENLARSLTSCQRVRLILQPIWN